MTPHETVISPFSFLITWNLVFLRTILFFSSYRMSWTVLSLLHFITPFLLVNLFSCYYLPVSGVNLILNFAKKHDLCDVCFAKLERSMDWSKKQWKQKWIQNRAIILCFQHHEWQHIFFILKTYLHKRKMKTWIFSRHECGKLSNAAPSLASLNALHPSTTGNY
jgi:hypothetical protein